MSKISIYYNDRASSADKNPWIMGLSHQLFRHDLQVRSPADYESLDHAINEDLEQGTEYIFSVGGDGTAHTIIQKLVNTEVKFMCIPAGTANDFASELGITKNIDNVVKIFQRKSVKKVDVLKVNSKYLLSHGGVGVAAEVAHKVNTYRRELKGFRYLMSELGASVYTTIFAKEMLLKPFHRFELTLESADFLLSGERLHTGLVLISNQAKLGGKFHIAPETLNDDGRFHVVVFLHQNRRELLSCALKLLKGEAPIDDPHFIEFETDHLTMQSHSGTIPFLGDGEILQESDRFEISILPRALEVFNYDDDLLACQYYDLSNIEM
jgi:diacylglycerol kinase (ATP)